MPRHKILAIVSSIAILMVTVFISCVTESQTEEAPSDILVTDSRLPPESAAEIEKYLAHWKLLATTPEEAKAEFGPLQKEYACPSQDQPQDFLCLEFQGLAIQYAQGQKTLIESLTLTESFQESYRGIHIGSPKDAVSQIFGPAPLIDPDTAVYTTPSETVEFEFRKDKISKITCKFFAG